MAPPLTLSPNTCLPHRIIPSLHLPPCVCVCVCKRRELDLTLPALGKRTYCTAPHSDQSYDGTWSEVRTICVLPHLAFFAAEPCVMSLSLSALSPPLDSKESGVRYQASAFILKQYCKARLCRKALAFHSYACRTRGCISAFKGLPSPQRPRRALQMLSGTARSALASPALLCLLLFKPASEKTKKLKVRVDLTHALKHFGHDHLPSGSLLILGACRRALSTLVDG